MGWRVNAVQHKYKGYKQGYKVYITDPFGERIKYPLRKGYFYTDMDKDRAIQRALNERDYNDLKGYLRYVIRERHCGMTKGNSQLLTNNDSIHAMLKLQGTF